MGAARSWREPELQFDVESSTLLLPFTILAALAVAHPIGVNIAANLCAFWLAGWLQVACDLIVRRCRADRRSWRAVVVVNGLHPCLIHIRPSARDEVLVASVLSVLAVTLVWFQGEGLVRGMALAQLAIDDGAKTVPAQLTGLAHMVSVSFPLPCLWFAGVTILEVALAWVSKRFG